MLSISPQSADIAAAVAVTTTAASWLALRYDEKPAEVENANARLIKSAGGGLMTLTADDIPCDGPAEVPYEYRAPVKKFGHTPTITLRRGDEVAVVTGPVEPVIPHTNETTKGGWERYYAAAASARSAAKEAAKAIAAARKKFFETRDDAKEAEYQERCDQAEAAGRPAPKRRKRKEPKPDWMNYIQDPTLVAMIMASRTASQKKKRIRKFEHNGHTNIGGRNYVPFDEEMKHEDGTGAPAIRSWLGIVALALFNSALPKGAINFGDDKEIEYSSKTWDLPRIFALDKSHIVLDKSRRCAFIVDLDGWWVDLATLRRVLRLLLPPEFMPNLITYRGAEDGKGGIENPHLVWLLPPGSRVVLGPGQKNLRQQFRLHEMVQKGIVSHLIPVGADPGHTNICKTKNPLSPGYSVEACDDHFQTMEAWRAFLPTITPNINEMKRRAKTYRAAKEADVAVEESQAIWNDGIADRSLETAAAQRRKDPVYRAAVRHKTCMAFVDWLYHPADGVVTKRLIGKHGDTRAVRSVLAAQRQFVIDLNMTPSEFGRWCERGRDAALNAVEFKPLPPNATKAERKERANAIKKLACQRTQANKLKVNCGLIAEEIEARLAGGVPVVKAEVVNALVKTGTVGRSTAYAHFDDVLRVVQQTARYQDHTSATKSTQANQPIEVLPVSIPEQESYAQPVTVAASAPVKAFGSVRNPGKSTDLPLPVWVVDKDSLTELEEACRIRGVWRVAVAVWRSAKHRQLPDDGVDLAEDPEFRNMVLNRSAWANHRRH
jgi:hypothetical protein